jgi:adenylosuccinate lyase
MVIKKKLPKIFIPPQISIEKISDNPLFALSTIDGRDKRLTRPIAQYFSEFATFTTRAELSGKYLIALDVFGGILPRKLKKEEREELGTIGYVMSEKDCEEIKNFEKKTNHDVVALRLFLKRKFSDTTLSDLAEFIDIGLTSDDKNNLTLRLNLMRATNAIIIPVLDKIVNQLDLISLEHADTSMQARTHGQAAGPTTFGKEIAVFVQRLKRQIEKLQEQQLTGKLNGAVGNWNSMRYVFPEKNWLAFSREFISSLGLNPNEHTTQINPYDDVVEYLQNLARINNILISLDGDIWHYIADNWIIQIPKEGESGSSAMPQKVNPIDFEKSEGNLEEANDLIDGLSKRLPRSRLQRDLRDSTQGRNIGSILGYSLVGYASLLSGLSKIKVNKNEMKNVLDSDWTILSEAVQIYLRSKTNMKDPYDALKKLVRGAHMTSVEWKNVIDALPIDDDIKKHFRNLTPEVYMGYAKELSRSSARK